MLDTAPKLQFCAISRKTNNENLRNSEKANFGTDFGLFGQNLGPPKKNFCVGFISTGC